MTLTEARDQKVNSSSERRAYYLDQESKRIEEAKKEFLRNNPDVGVLNRNGTEVYYRIVNGEAQEFTI